MMKVRLRRLISFLFAVLICLLSIPIDSLFINNVYAESHLGTTNSDYFIPFSENEQMDNGIGSTNERYWFKDGEKAKILNKSIAFDYQVYGSDGNQIGTCYLMPCFYEKGKDDPSVNEISIGNESIGPCYVLVYSNGTSDDNNRNFKSANLICEDDIQRFFASKDVVIPSFSVCRTIGSPEQLQNVKLVPVSGEKRRKGVLSGSISSTKALLSSTNTVESKYLGDYIETYLSHIMDEDLSSIGISTIYSVSKKSASANENNISILPNGVYGRFVVRDGIMSATKDNQTLDADIRVKLDISVLGEKYDENSAVYKSLMLSNAKDGVIYKERLKIAENIWNSSAQIRDQVHGGSEEKTTSEELEKARVLDAAGNTTVNEWFWKINYFFAHGVDATEDKSAGGLGVDGFRVSDYGYGWIKHSETEDARDSVESPDPNEPSHVTNQDVYKYDEYAIGTGWVSLDESSKVTLEEDLRIRTYFNIMAQYMYFGGSEYQKGPYTAYDKTFNSFIEYVAYLANTGYGLRNSVCIGKIDTSNEYTLFNPDTINVSGEDGTTSSFSRQNAEAAAESKFRKIGDKPSYYSAAVNFDAIVDYFGYGAVSNETYVDENGNTGDIKYNQAIINCVPIYDIAMSGTSSEDSTNLNKASLSFRGLGLPRLDELGRVSRSMHSFEFYGRLNTALMFVRQYAEIPKTKGKLEGEKSTKIGDGAEDIESEEDEEEIEEEEDNEDENSGDTDSEEWYYNTGSKGTYSTSALLEIQDTSADKRIVSNVEDMDSSELSDFIQCPKLETFLNENNSVADGKSVNIPDDVAKIIAAYIHIHDGLDTLFGGEDNVLSDTWLSPELKRIYIYYDEIKKYENEPSIDAATNTAEPDEREAFRMFFQFDDAEQPMFTDNYLTGVALSATYVPLVTNLYDPESLSILEDSQSFVDDFHYKYGFNRKALFIDTDEDAAVKAYVTGEKSGLRVATLKDMLEPEKDIVLYVDTNMYNINKVADMQQLAYSRIQNSEEAGTDSGGLFQSIGDGLANFMEIGAENIYKSGAVKLYTNKYASGSAAYGTDEGKSKKSMWFSSIWSPDNFILSTEKIEEFTYADEYQPMQGAAFTYGIYRDKNIYNICQNQSANPQPVFISSSSLAGMKGQTKEQFNTIFNYLLLKNLENNKQLDSDVDLDEDTPLFIDIYGNISTQSGLVVVPAACNSTLYTAGDFNVATAGFLSAYNKFDSYRLPEKYNNADKYMSDLGFSVEEDVEDGKPYWIIDTINVGNSIIMARGLGLSSKKIRSSLYELAKTTMSENQLNSSSLFNQRVNMIMEVMRGAPIEHIDFEKEGLLGVRNLDKTAIYVTYRVEQLSELFTSGSNGNSLVELPNLAYMSHIEYVVVFLFKALFAVGIFILMITIYVDGVAGVLGWKTILKFTFSIASVILGIIFVPSALNVSYYQTNKWLLQSEMTYMNMINVEKNALGKETGIVEVRKPESNTELFLKLDEVRIPWYMVIEDIFNTNQFKKMNDIYNNAFQSSIYMSFDGVQQKGNGLYISVDELINSSTIVFDNYVSDTPDVNGYIFQVIEDNQEMSYVLPYHFILDQLLYDIQKYNEPREGSSFVTKFKSNGDIMTYGLIEPYLLSNNFLLSDSQNLLGLYEIYGISPTSMRHISILDNSILKTGDASELIEHMRSSLWCQKDAYSEDVLKSKLAELDYEARKFIVENRFLLNKVSDETFLKCMALDLAVKHNDIFGVPAARSYEVMNVDTRDIMRMSLAPKSQVMKHASKSFANFVLNYGGFFAVCCVTFLIVMYWIVSLVKPLLMITLLVLLIVSYIYNKLVRRHDNKSFEGYLVSITLMCLVNILYALSIKFSIWIPSLEVNALIAILLQVIVQFVYVVVLLGIGYIVTKNAADIGFYTYKTIYDTHMAGRIQSAQLTTDKIISKITKSSSDGMRRRANNYNRNTRTSGLTGNDILRQMQDRDEELSNNGRFK